MAAAKPAGATSGVFDCVIDPSRTVRVGSPVPGILAEVLVERGDTVRRGQVLARLESSVEEATERLDRTRAASTADIDSAIARLELAKTRLGRSSQLLNRQVVSESSVDELRAAQRVAEQDLARARMEQELARNVLERSTAILEQRRIRSPVEGIVTARPLSPGEFIRDEGHVVALAALDPLHVEVFLPAEMRGMIAIGQQAELWPDKSGKSVHQAMVTVVDGVMDATSGTFGVRLSLPNPINQLPAGQRCRVRFPEKRTEPG